MKIIILGIMILSLCGGLTPAFATQFLGTAGSLFSEKLPNPPTGTGLPNTVETSQIAVGGVNHLWFGTPPSYTVLSHATSTDADFAVYSNIQTAINPTNFNSVAIDPTTGIFYSIGVNASSYNGSNGNNGNGHKMWRSTDGVTWTMLNGGAEVLTLNGVKAKIPTTNILWNPSLVITPDGVFHILVETGTGPPPWPDSSKIGYIYSQATLNGNSINFDANVSSQLVIPNAICGDTKYVPERNAFIVIHPMFDDSIPQNGDTRGSVLRCSYANASSDLTQPSSWHTVPPSVFIIQMLSGGTSGHGVMLSDPSFTDMGAGKNSKISLMYSYNQSSMNRAYADVTVLQLYDAIGGANYAQTTVASILKIKTGQGVTGLSTLGAGVGIDLNTAIGTQYLSFQDATDDISGAVRVKPGKSLSVQ